MSLAGHPVVGDLFASFDFDRLPDAVNKPTYNRLCTFLRDDLRRADLAPPRMSVREVVDAIKMYNTSGTLCWAMTREPGGGGDAVQDELSNFGSTQRVFAHCAKAVFAKVEMAVAAIAREKPDVTAMSIVAPMATSESISGYGKSGDLAQWLASHDLHDLTYPLNTLGARVLKDLVFGVREGDITVESLIEAGAESRLQTKRLMREAATLLNASET